MAALRAFINAVLLSLMAIVMIQRLLLEENNVLEIILKFAEI